MFLELCVILRIALNENQQFTLQRTHAVPCNGGKCFFHCIVFLEFLLRIIDVNMYYFGLHAVLSCDCIAESENLIQ